MAESCQQCTMNYLFGRIFATLCFSLSGSDVGEGCSMTVQSEWTGLAARGSCSDGAAGLGACGGAARLRRARGGERGVPPPGVRFLRLTLVPFSVRLLSLFSNP